MKKALTEGVIVARLVWFRVSCYFIIPFATTFLALTETWSQQTWNETGQFLIVRMFVSCLVAGITTFVAFMDNTMGKAREAVEQHRRTSTILQPVEVKTMTEEERKGV